MKKVEQRLKALQEIIALSALYGRGHLLRYLETWLELHGNYIFLRTELLSNYKQYSLYFERKTQMQVAVTAGLTCELQQRNQTQQPVH